MEIWMDVDVALGEVPVNLLPLIDDTDFKTREESVTFNQAGLDLVWNFVTTAGVFTQTAVTPTDTAGDYDWVNQGNGMYTIEIPASGGVSINNDTEGFGWFTGFATGILPWRGPVIGFRAAGLNNALIDSAYSATRGLAGTAVPDAAADAAGGLPISDAGGLDLDTQIGTDIDAILLDTAEIGAAGAGLTEAGGTGDQLTAIPWNAAWDAEVQSEVDDALVAFFTSAAALVDLIWDESLTGHTTANSAGRKLRELGANVIRAGTAQAGASMSITLDAGASAVDGSYDPSNIIIIAGTGEGQSRLILQYNGTSKVATVDREWRVTPDATSEFIITGAAATQHVNEGLAQGGGASTITLNADASAVDGTYVGQIVFIRGGTGSDQARLITAYNGTTKVATVSAAWDTAPDSASVYIIMAAGRTIAEALGVQAKADVNAEADTALTDYGPALDSVATEARLAELDAANIPTDLATLLTRATEARLAELDAGNLPADIADIPTVAEFNARTLAAAAYFDPTSDTVTVGTNNDKTGYGLTTAERAAVADKILGRSIAGGADGGRTVEQALATIRNRWAIVAGTLTVYENDGTTPMYESTIGTTASDPISSFAPTS